MAVNADCELADPTLDPLEFRAWRLLRERVGRMQAIRVPDLARLLSDRWNDPAGYRPVTARQVQDIVKRLREQHGCPILSSASRPPGYWWAETPEELEACIREQKRKAISTLICLRALRRHRARLQGQQEI